MAWQSVGTITVGPNDLAIPIGTIDLDAGANTLWVRAVQKGGESPWPYGFGLLSWRTTEGRELGTAKVYGHTEGETYRLGTGLSPVERRGVLWFEPRSYNLRWIKASGAMWSLEFQQQSGTTGGEGPSGYAASFANSAGAGLALARVVFP